MRHPQQPPDRSVGGNGIKQRPTLVDVARLAGVSVATASNALTGKRAVSRAARERVERVASDLGYEPNQVARALVAKRTYTIGLIIPDIANPFFAELVRGAERAIGEEGYSLLIVDTDNDPARERHAIASLLDRRVDGLLVVPTSGTHLDALNAARAACPTVLVDRTCPGWRGDVVVGDNTGGIHAVVDHLVELGHRRIAYVTGDLATSTAQERFEGFTARLGEHGLRPTRVIRSAFTIESVRPLLDALFTGRSPATAVCAADDLLALAVLDAARANGRRVPEDVSVTGYDDIAYARLAWPRLTTVRLSAPDMGEFAVKLLLDGAVAARATQTLRVLTSLVVRDSTTHPAT